MLLISNSKDLLNQKLGSRIDELSKEHSIVRFNLFQTKGYEESVGSCGTNIFCQRACSDIPRHPPTTFDEVVLFITHCEIQDGMEQQSRLYANWYGDISTIVPLADSMRLHRKVRLGKGKRLTVGIQAIDYFLRNQDKYNEEVVLVGWDLSKFGSHYFPRGPVDSGYHDPGKEQAYLNKLKEEQKIRFIEEMV